LSDLDFKDMLEIQRGFEGNFFDPEELSMPERERWVEKFVLHMMDQSTSLLNKINWKKHEHTAPVEYDEVMEELVDVYKYWLAIMVVLNADFEGFEKAFVKRSREVKERYEREMQ